MILSVCFFLQLYRALVSISAEKDCDILGQDPPSDHQLGWYLNYPMLFSSDELNLS